MTDLLQQQKKPCSNLVFAELYISNFKDDYYRLEMTKALYISNVIHYLTFYPLQGKKKIVFNRWKHIFQNQSILRNQSLPSSKSFLRFQRFVDTVQNKEKN